MFTKKNTAYSNSPRSMISPSGKGQRCSTCVFFSADQRCKLVNGDIKPEATCILWSHTGSLDLRFISGKEATAKLQGGQQMSKEEAGYLHALPTYLRPEPQKSFRCGTCTFFHPAEGSYGHCFPTQGRVHEHACCNAWDNAAQPTKKYDYLSGAQMLPDIEDLY